MPAETATQAPRAYTLFMLVRATKEWLGLPPAERFGVLDRAIRPLLAAHPAVSLRFFDTEAYAARISDVLVWRTEALGAWEWLVEGLRETPFWGRYPEVLEIPPGVENAYATHYGQRPVGGAGAA